MCYKPLSLVCMASHSAIAAGVVIFILFPFILLMPSEAEVTTGELVILTGVRAAVWTGQER